MARTTWVLATTTALGLAASLWLYLDNRSLRDALDERPAQVAEPTPAQKPATREVDAWAESASRKTPAQTRTNSGPEPTLPEDKKESRGERRARRQQEFAAMFGRGENETEEEYRARIGPMITAGLLIPRQRLEAARREAEEKAHVTAEQSKKIDKAIEKTYADVLDYTNKAIADGQLSPYERNVSGWLEYAGGLGTILGDAQGQFNKVLSPEQAKSLYDSGFEWGEYLGANTPWEQLKPPPPPK